MIATGEGARASCEGLEVSYLDRLDGARALEPADRIRVCIPDGDGSSRYQLSLATSQPAARLPVSFPNICVIPPEHGGELSAESPVSLTLFSLDRKFCDEQALQQYGTRASINECRVVPDPFLRRIGSVMAAAFRLQRTPEAPFLEPLARDLARHVIFTYGRTTGGSSSKGISPERLARVISKIDKELDGALRLKELADEAHMSEFHFSRMFRHSTGYSPHMYITLRRMDRAKELLAESEQPLNEVATAVGYKTQAHFTSVFHSYCGMTPGAFRRCHPGDTTESTPG